MSIREVSREEILTRRKRAEAYQKLRKTIEFNQNKALTPEQVRALKNDCGFVLPCVCVNIQWSIRVGIELDGEPACPDCGEPAEEFISMIGTPCFGHK